MSASPRFGFLLLAPGQASKEVTANEALLTLETITAAAVEEPPRSSPPASPAEGECYIVAASPTGAWAGQAGKLAAYTAGGWRFVAPTPGLGAFVKSTATTASYVGGAWELGSVRASRLLVDGEQVVGAQASAIADPSGGTTIDAQARTALGAILTALRTHGLIAT